MDLETIGFYMLLAGLVVAIAGWLFLLVRAFRTRLLWGFGVLLFPPSGLVFPFVHWERARRPVAVLAFAGLIIAVPYGVNWYHNHFISLGPREKMVDGELHITLTGWSGGDYSILKGKTGTVVLQLANPDVDDTTLA